MRGADPGFRVAAPEAERSAANNQASKAIPDKSCVNDTLFRHLTRGGADQVDYSRPVAYPVTKMDVGQSFTLTASPSSEVYTFAGANLQSALASSGYGGLAGGQSD